MTITVYLNFDLFIVAQASDPVFVVDAPVSDASVVFDLPRVNP